MQEFFSKNIEDTLKILKTSKKGLTQNESEKRYQEVKDLQILEGKKKSFLLKFLSQFSDLMVLILLISAVVSIVIGVCQRTSSEIVDGSIILGIVLINAFLGLIQENKAEKSMQALKKMSEPECMVLCDGVAVKKNTKYLVPGDIVLFESGSIIPADLRLVESHNLFLNESSLTGESEPVSKQANIEISQNSAISEQKNMVFKGTNVVLGRGEGVVCAVGTQTELGKIASVLSETKKELTPLQKSIKSVGRILTILILLMAGITFVLEILARGRPMEAFLTAIAISVAAIPESMPAVITIIMSLGIFNLAKQKAIIRRMHSVETLGCCDVICSDKTGTITQNKMSVLSVFESGKFLKNEKPSEILLAGITLCNDTVKSNSGYTGDPTEVALTEFASKFGIEKNLEDLKYTRVQEISFDSKRKLMSTLNIYNGQTMFTKGAVDVLLKKCNKILIDGKEEVLRPDLIEKIFLANEKMTENALRVIAVAYKANPAKFEENDLVFVGLVGMIDPPKKETAQAVKKCKKAGMRPIMITGDHAKTAFAIARQVGIATDISEVMLGSEIDELSDEEFLKKIEKISVYARVSAENKARIVTLLKEKGHIVAMTGDGVNDAPSLKRASIGIGMGQSGTDVVKEVADMIITDDNFSTIVVAVEEGRKVYKNIQKTVKFLFAANMGEILSLFLATILFPFKTFLLPVQILFVNLITDSLPAIALGVEKAESGIMEKSPRKEKEGLFSNGHGKELLFMGFAQTAIILLAYVIGLKTLGEKTAMTMAFYTLNMIQLFFMFCARTENSVFKSNPFKNRMFNFSLIFGFGLLAVIALTPFSAVLGLVSLNWQLWLITIFLSISVIVINEIYKFFRNKKQKRV